MQRTAQDCVLYFKRKSSGVRKLYQMKVALVGMQGSGKSSLAAHLKTTDKCKPEHEQPSDVLSASEWTYAPTESDTEFHFCVWDFRGRDEMCPIHHCFVSKHFLYVLVWDITRGDGGISEMKSWLDSLAVRSPHSCVIVVGTHLDQVSTDRRSHVTELLQQVLVMTREYEGRLFIPEPLAVSLADATENVGVLKEAIYKHAAEYQCSGQGGIMGREVPESYCRLNGRIEAIQEKVRISAAEPVMHIDAFGDLVREVCPDMDSREELETATRFLVEAGTLLHYQDGGSLSQVYFIEPSWLCGMLASIVQECEVRFSSTKGILQSTDVQQLFEDKSFPSPYLNQFVQLLNILEIVVSLTQRIILVPSLLPEEHSQELPFHGNKPPYQRYILFGNPLPTGFWSRLLSRVMHSEVHVCKLLDLLAVEGKSCGKSSVPCPSIIEAPESQPSPTQTPSSPSSPPEKSTSIRFPIGENVVESLSSGFTLGNAKLEYWKEGLVYSDPNFCFTVSPLSQESLKRLNKTTGIQIQASPTVHGTAAICCLVATVTRLVQEWYPGMANDSTLETARLEQRIPCYECQKLGRAVPFEFEIEQCIPLLSSRSARLECRYRCDDTICKHAIPLQHIVPDLFLPGINPKFLLDPKEITFPDGSVELIRYGSFSQGEWKGKPVVVKKYHTSSLNSLNELSTEVAFLEKSFHPCVLSLVGLSIHPFLLLAVERAPLGSLESHLITGNNAIHRVVLFRIASQVLAALDFMHKAGIMFRDLKVSNVLLWSVDKHALCHCKVSNLDLASCAICQTRSGSSGMSGGAISVPAPELLSATKFGTVDCEKTSVFSFGMLLYQMITRRYPFHDNSPDSTNSKILAGERPSYTDTPVAEAGFYLLTELMELCWSENPCDRPDTNSMLLKFLDVSFQAAMSVVPVESTSSLRRAVSSTWQQKYSQTSQSPSSSDLWVCCDSSKGTDILIYSMDDMDLLERKFIKDVQLQCICACGDNIWVCSREGIGTGVIDCFDIASHDLVYTRKRQDMSVSCIACSDSTVYVGTLDGFCYSFNINLYVLKSSKPIRKYISEQCINGIVVTKSHVWVTYTKYMYFLNLRTLDPERSFRRKQNPHAFIGQLAMYSESDTVWSAHLGGSILSAWHSETEKHMYDIDVQKLLKLLGPQEISPEDCIMTAMTPALDTVWVGMASGHILVIHGRQLLSYFKPYQQYVRFLCPVPRYGPCGAEDCTVLSGGKGYQPLFPDVAAIVEGGEDSTKGGIVMLWEAYTSKILKQTAAMKNEAINGNFLKDHNHTGRLIYQQGFKDDTDVLENCSWATFQHAVPEEEHLQHSTISLSNSRGSSASLSGATEDEASVSSEG